MATTGETIENPVTGERLTFVETAADSGGQRLRIALHLAADAHNAGSHRHTEQEERIDVVAGQVRMVLDSGEARTVSAGESVTIAPGVPHVWWNDSGAPAELAIEYRPALRTEEFFESFFALGRAGRTDRRGAPRFLQLVLMARRYAIYDGKAPVWLQKIAMLLLTPLALLLGHRARYVERQPKIAGSTSTLTGA